MPDDQPQPPVIDAPRCHAGSRIKRIVYQCSCEHWYRSEEMRRCIGAHHHHARHQYTHAWSSVLGHCWSSELGHLLVIGAWALVIPPLTPTLLPSEGRGS